MARAKPTATGQGGAAKRVLEALRRDGPQTARELSARLGGGAVAMRAHLRVLQAAGLVAHDEERQAVGRPVRRFRVAPPADALFPKLYDELAIHLVETLVAELGEGALEKIFSRWEKEAARYLGEVLPKEPAARLAALAEQQSKLGFMASQRPQAGGAVLTERNCPLAKVAARYPVLCEREAALFQKVLGRKVGLVCCQARGDAVCEFAIRGR